jgi:putative FmdB family regulatory protein
MPTYPYKCARCGENHDIVKSIKLASQEEICPRCEITLDRVWVAPQIIGAKVENAEYNVGLGCVTKSKRHREEIAKSRGLIEVGNETPDTLHKESVVKRQVEREKEWDKL